MSDDDHDDATTFAVVVNDEEQYSIWNEQRPIPPGWRAEGFKGRKADCLSHIEKVWTDMRPLSVRRAIANSSVASPTAPPREADDLVKRLAARQPIVFVGRPQASREELEAQLTRRRVYVRFDQTGTELGVRVDDEAAAAARTAMQKGEPIRLEGELVLNYQRVRFAGELDARELPPKGMGSLAVVGDA